MPREPPVDMSPQMRVAGEVLPGLPLCHAIDRPDFPALITKSGGFGPPDTLLRLQLR